MDPFNIYGGSYMITSRANLANSASVYSVNHVTEYLCKGDSFPRGSYMITSRANLAYSASGYCMNPVSECDSFPPR